MTNYSNLGRDLSDTLSAYCTGQHNQYEYSELCSCDAEKGLQIEDVKIFAHGRDEAEYFWSYDTCHLFPRAEELAALGFVCRKTLIFTCGLLLKGAWEKHVADLRHWQHDNSMNVRLDDLLEKAYFPDRRRVHETFSPDTEAFYQILQQSGFGKDPLLRYQDAFATLIHEMRLNRFYLEPLASATFTLFIRRKEAELKAYQDATAAEIEKFHQEKFDWLNLKDQLGDILLRLEDCRIANKQLEVLWLNEFGKEFMALQEGFESLSLYREMLRLKQDDPALSLEELRDRAAGQLDEAEERLETLEANIDLGSRLKFASEVDASEKAWVKKECDDILRQISLLTHPDRLEHNPQFARMTESQKRYLSEMFLHSRELKNSKSVQSANDICWNEGKLFKLAGMLANIEEVYATAGIDANVEMMIKGESIADKIAFLEKENRFLAQQVAESKTLLAQSFADRDAIEKHRQLGSPELYDRIKEEMRIQTGKYRLEIELIQNDLNTLYSA